MTDILGSFLKNELALKKYLSRFFSKPQEIEDVAQETFLKAFVAESKAKIHSPKAYLFRTAKHTALNELAKKANQTTDFIEDSESSSVLQDKEQVGADDTLDSKRKLLVFTKAVASLPPNCRRVFLLRKMDGLKVKEIARHLDISVSGVEKHIATGLVKCNQYFKEQGYDPSEFGASVRSDETKTRAEVAVLLQGRDE